MAQQVDTVAIQPRRERNGVVYTKRWVVDLMLDLAEYTPDRKLQALSIVEPSGDGSFVAAIVERLVESSGRFGQSLELATGAFACYELDPLSVAICRATTEAILESSGVDGLTSVRLTHDWIKQSDISSKTFRRSYSHEV